MANKSKYSASEQKCYKIGKSMGKNELTIFGGMNSLQKKSYINGKQSSKKIRSPKKTRLIGK